MRFATLMLLSLLNTWSLSAEETVLPAAFRNNVLLLNNQETNLGAAQWNAPEKNWGTLGELLKTTLPPADAQGLRPDVLLHVSIDGQTPWGGLKCLLMALSALGVRKARIELPEKQTVGLDLPGSDPAVGEVVALPLFAGSGVAQTENGGKRMNCSAGLLRGLVQQLPKATVSVKADAGIPATQVVGVLRDLMDAKAAAVAYLPVKEISAKEAADRKETKGAVDRAFGVLGRGSGGKKE